MAKKWTEDEDIYLEYLAFQGDANLQEAAEFLGRTVAAIVSRLVLLRKRNNEVCYLREPWSEKEDNFLRNNYKTLKNNQLAESLNRTVPAVSNRKKLLGLKSIRPIAVHREKIIEMARRGFYRSDIAKELNINEASLRVFLINEKIYCERVPYSISTEKIRKLNLKKEL